MFLWTEQPRPQQERPRTGTLCDRVSHGSYGSLPFKLWLPSRMAACRPCKDSPATAVSQGRMARNAITLDHSFVRSYPVSQPCLNQFPHPEQPCSGPQCSRPRPFRRWKTAVASRRPPHLPGPGKRRPGKSCGVNPAVLVTTASRLEGAKAGCAAVKPDKPPPAECLVPVPDSKAPDRGRIDGVSGPASTGILQKAASLLPSARPCTKS